MSGRVEVGEARWRADIPMPFRKSCWKIGRWSVTGLNLGLVLWQRACECRMKSLRQHRSVACLRSGTQEHSQFALHRFCATLEVRHTSNVAAKQRGRQLIVLACGVCGVRRDVLIKVGRDRTAGERRTRNAESGSAVAGVRKQTAGSNTEGLRW